MIIQAFLRWVETARTGERIRAASALGRAYVDAQLNGLDRRAAEMAMTFLLDDPSPKVRLALAEVLCGCSSVPRAIILGLAGDQPEIAYLVVSHSPVLTDDDLVDLAARGTLETRALIAARSFVSRGVAAAIAEIGDEDEMLILLENPGALLSRRSLKRIAERLGHSASVRDLLLARNDLPSAARHALVEEVGAALAAFGLVQVTIGEGRVQRVTREACDIAAVGMVGTTAVEELPDLVTHLRETGRLTPAFLLHALVTGRAEFFSAAIVDLSGVSEKRVRSILSGGRVHSIRALFESAGLGRDVSETFATAVLLWRQDGPGSIGGHATVSAELLVRLRRGRATSPTDAAMIDLLERLAFAEERQSARDYAELAARQAA
ncbi:MULTISPECIES: DUF2336 domain-containing protein [Ensifer]|uniref:DUF2336 domain-containing protein n=1 Tax=Ensifer adhaerens TaxID=106592 RepID=A0ABY8HJK1_ENSAD|nr:MULTISPECIES: DUF2336 domain-containing protein [Ensifer]MBD9542557.1 DUF2336 domain-containing protein [Ensifer sp. ENS04]MBD9569197.1 DUF2336 domain-containing protein [Ensifer sp. ENS08]ANK72197.1 hypothetical protein FA04_05880 [Ensifer adhaerens]KDP74372.1 hypothetical protein FA04_07155 [Ensifer adhaerens]KQX21146.1 hypothetical protein ASD01_30580 [Ensifer sp. Root423]